MRKIESNMVSAIRAGKNWRSGNTAVRWNGDVAEVFLRGNMIGKVGPGVMKITLADWNTNTTRSRVSALCHAFGRTLGVSNRNWTPYLIGRDGERTEISSNDWVEG